MRRSLCVSLLTWPLTWSSVSYAGLLDKAKSIKEGIDKAANTPTRVSINGKARLEESSEDLAKVFAAFQKKIGATPLMVYGASIGSASDVHVTYQSRYNPEKLETLHFVKGEIQGMPTKFTLTGLDVKVKDNVFDFEKVNLSVIPGLVRTARAKTSEASNGRKTFGSSVKIGQVWAKGQPTQIRIIVTVATDDGKTTMALIEEAWGSSKGAAAPKGASVGQLAADETGKIVGFRMI
jgi:hypothetical protein